MMQILEYHAPTLLDLVVDDEYKEDKNKEGCVWEGRRKKCIPLLVVQTIFKFLDITVFLKSWESIPSFMKVYLVFIWCKWCIYMSPIIQLSVSHIFSICSMKYYELSNKRFIENNGIFWQNNRGHISTPNFSY